MAAPLVSNAGYFNSVDDTIKVAVIGCGGRGTGAAMQALLTKQNVKLVAMADAFRDRLDECYKALTAEDNEEGNARVQALIDSLKEQGDLLEEVFAAFELPPPSLEL